MTRSSEYTHQSPRRPAWHLALGGIGLAITVVYLLVFAQGFLDNIAVVNGGQQPFINIGLAAAGFLLSVSLLIGYVRYFRRRQSGDVLTGLLLVTLAPAAIYYFA